MKPYVLSRIDETTLPIFDYICWTFTQIPNIDFSIATNTKCRDATLSCHILARACGRVFGLNVADGAFSPCFRHSWLTTSAEHVIDVYPVGMLTQSKTIQPILVDSSVAKHLYFQNIAGRNRFTDKKMTKLQWGQSDFEVTAELNEEWLKEAVDLAANQISDAAEMYYLF